MWHREAKAAKIQSQELAEAERLEHEALARRERAVAHGELSSCWMISVYWL